MLTHSYLQEPFMWDWSLPFSSQYFFDATVIIIATGKKNANGSKELYTVEGPLSKMSATWPFGHSLSVYEAKGMYFYPLKMVITLQSTVIAPASEAH